MNSEGIVGTHNARGLIELGVPIRINACRTADNDLHTRIGGLDRWTGRLDQRLGLGRNLVESSARQLGKSLEFVEDGVSVIVAPPDPAALGSAIDRLFALPESRLQEMGAEGRRRVAHISWDTVLDQLTESIR